MLRQFADAEAEFVVVNGNPDFCEVDGCVTPYDIAQKLSEEKTRYSENVFSRGKKVLAVGSVIKGVVGNAGKGVESGVAEESGDIVTTEGSKTLTVNGRPACHDYHQVDMNVKT